MEQFISQFDNKVNRLKAVGQKMEGDILTFMLLLSSNLQQWELSLIMSALDFEKKDDVYEAAKKQMRQMLGKHVASTDVSKTETTIKTEPTFVIDDEVLAAHGYYKRNHKNPRGGFNQNKGYQGRGKLSTVAKRSYPSRGGK